MSLVPRLFDLIERYPDELTDAELAELRSAAERDPRLHEVMDAVLEIDSAIAGLPETIPQISESGQRRLDLAVRTATAWGSSPAAPLEAHVEEEATRAWGSSPAAPLEAKADNVVSLFSRRPVQLALAALLVIAAGLLANALLQPAPPDDPYGGGIKGDGRDSASPLDRSLILQPFGGARLDDGAERSADQPIRLTARLKNPASLALIEVQGDVSAVVWPPPDSVWLGGVGPNLLQPLGASPDYRPSQAGAASYVLVGRDTALTISARRLSEADLLAANPGAVVLDRRTIRWTDPETP